MNTRQDISTEKIIELYKSGLSPGKIGQKLNCSEIIPRYRLKRLGIKTRSQSEACLKGKFHPGWKGGKIQSRGYILMRNPSHPRANKHGYVAEHIIKWEEYHHRSVPKNCDIHHIDGRPNNNDPRNLIALTRKQHHTAHQIYQKRIRELEDEIAKLKQSNIFQNGK